MGWAPFVKRLLGLYVFYNFVDFNVMESNEQGIHYGFTLGPENSGYIDVGAEVIIS